MPFAELLHELHIANVRTGLLYDQGENVNASIDYACKLENEIQKRYADAFAKGQAYEKQKQCQKS